MKKTFITLLLAFAGFCTVQAQGFEWAKGYSSTQENNHIIGTVTDSEGNLYIAGVFRNDATWDGERLLPIAPYGPHNNTVNTIIAKISPTGEMVWKKVIHSNNGQNNFPQDIKKVGDSAFACLVHMSAPTDGNYTYYLDTLVSDWPDYPVQVKYLMNLPIYNAFILFDFNGNVKEQHFLHLTYTDYNGEDIFSPKTSPSDSTLWYCSQYFDNASFDIDGEGNIYISRRAMDRVSYSTPSSGTHTYEAWEGTIRGIKFWVDRRLAGYYQITGNRPMEWYPQIVKFAPHFDTMLACRYVIQGQSDSMAYYPFYTVTKVDDYGNVYHICHLNVTGYYQDDSFIFDEHENTLYIDTVSDISFYLTDRVTEKSFLTRFDSSLNPQWVVALDDSVINQSQALSISFLYDLTFDYDSNLMFLSIYSNRGIFGDTNHFYSIHMVDGVPLNIKNEMAVLSFKMAPSKPELYSVGAVPSVLVSQGEGNVRGNLYSGNNRVMVQSAFVGGLRLPENNIIFSNIYRWCLGVVFFDYRGRVIGGTSYNTSSPNSFPGPISLQDSVLYLTNLLAGDNATFGDIQVPAQGYNACVAKYVDAAFMTPYVYDSTGNGGGEVSITLVEDGTALVAYPNPFRQSVRIKVQGGQLKEHNGTVTAILTDLSGHREQVRLTPDAPGQYTLDLTSRPQATYLLTLTTADGKTHTVGLLKHSDIFGQ